MNTPFQIYPDKKQSFQEEGLDFRAHYETVVAGALLSIKRHRLFIVSFVALVMASALMILPLLPRKYSAEVLVYPNLFSTDGNKSVALASVDAASIVSSEARLIRSDPILRAVVKRLGLDQVTAESRSPTSSAMHWLRAMLLPETLENSAFDRTVATLRSRLVVMSDTRSYLISVSYTAPSAVEAARMVNTLAQEYVRDKALQRNSSAVVAAEEELGRQLAIYGEKHPKVLRAMEGLEAARAVVNGTVNAENPGSITTGESVTLAVPNHIPTSPKGVKILGVSFVLALPTGIVLAVRYDRRASKRKLSVDQQQQVS